MLTLQLPAAVAITVIHLSSNKKEVTRKSASAMLAMRQLQQFSICMLNITNLTRISLRIDLQASR